MARKTSAPSHRQAILDAALRVANGEGLLALTLDNVAREAGVSKGGLIYHFASKDELLRGLLEHFGGKLEAALIERVAADPMPAGRWVRALFDITFPHAADPSVAPFDTELGRFCTTLFAAVAVNPALIIPLRPLGEKIRGRILAEGPDGVQQVLTWLMIDGLYMWQMFGLMAPDDPLREQMIAEIRKRVRPDSAREKLTANRRAKS